MSVQSRSTPAALPGRLDALAFGLLCVMPLGMALINRSAQPLLVAAALAAVSARAAAGDLPEVVARLRATLSRPVGLLCLAFLVFAAASLSWGHHLRTSLSVFGEVTLAAGSALVLHAALPRRIPGWVPKLAAVAIALGCFSVVAELSTGMAVRTHLGTRNHTFIFKRSVTAMLILGWPVAGLLWASGRRAIAIALLGLFCIATYTAHSSATALGLSAGLAAATLTAWSARAGSRVLAAALMLALVAAPILGDAAFRVLPTRVVERLQFAHADDRIRIWQSFGEVVKRRPIGGAGFGTSTVMAQEPVADEVPADRRVLLGAWHAHNGYLQLWSETGLVGAALAGAALLLLALGIGRLPPVQAVVTAAILGGAGAIMLVGHSLWQGWWPAVLGTAAVVVARLPYADVSVRPRKPVART